MEVTKTIKKALKNLNVKQESDSADVYIYGAIVTDDDFEEGISAVDVRDTLKALEGVKTINLHINSPGGNVFEGLAIYNMLKQSKAEIDVYIDGLAASIASVIAMSGDAVFMPSNAMMMIHNPWVGGVAGNAKDLRKEADDLDKIAQSSVQIYLDKVQGKLDKDQLEEIMDNETWLSAQEALDYGFVDEILEANQVAACVDKSVMKHYVNVPEQLVKQEEKPAEKQEQDTELRSRLKQQIAAQIKQIDLEMDSYQGG